MYQRIGLPRNSLDCQNDYTLAASLSCFSKQGEWTGTVKEISCFAAMTEVATNMKDGNETCI